MSKGLKTFLGAAVVAITAFAASAQAHHGVPENTPPARGNGPVVYVYGGNNPGFYYDSIILAHYSKWDGTDAWQLLEPTHPNTAVTGLETEFGPGDEEFYGGRWYLDTDGTAGLSAGDTFFLCPLLGPGYEVE